MTIKFDHPKRALEFFQREMILKYEPLCREEGKDWPPSLLATDLVAAGIAFIAQLGTQHSAMTVRSIKLLEGIADLAEKAKASLERAQANVQANDEATEEMFRQTVDRALKKENPTDLEKSLIQTLASQTKKN